MNSFTTIRAGDVVSRPKVLGFVTHVGVALAPNVIFQNTPEKGEHLATLEEFSCGKPVKVHRNGGNPSIVLARAQRVLASPQKYDLVQNNCEHTTAKILQGIARSPQLAFWVMMALLCVAVMVFSRR